MNDQERTHPEETAGHQSPVSGVTHPHADLYHGYLVEEFSKSIQAGSEAAVARWGYTWLHSLDDEQAEAQREAWGFQPQDALDQYNHGCLLAQREDFAGAAQAFANALAQKPEFAEAQFNRALALEHAGKTQEARDARKGYIERYGDLSEEETRMVKDRLTALADA